MQAKFQVNKILYDLPDEFSTKNSKRGITFFETCADGLQAAFHLVSEMFRKSNAMLADNINRDMDIAFAHGYDVFFSSSFHYYNQNVVDLTNIFTKLVANLNFDEWDEDGAKYMSVHEILLSFLGLNSLEDSESLSKTMNFFKKFLIFSECKSTLCEKCKNDNSPSEDYQRIFVTIPQFEVNRGSLTLKELVEGHFNRVYEACPYCRSEMVKRNKLENAPEMFIVQLERGQYQPLSKSGIKNHDIPIGEPASLSGHKYAASIVIELLPDPQRRMSRNYGYIHRVWIKRQETWFMIDNNVRKVYTMKVEPTKATFVMYEKQRSNPFWLRLDEIQQNLVLESFENSNWLNDDAIDSYLDLVCIRSMQNEGTLPQVYAKKVCF